jgi:hypothetical protein
MECDVEMKQYKQYRMDFGGKVLNLFSILCGLSLFFRVAYYFMLINPVGCPVAEVLLSMILPLLLCAAAMVVLKYFKLNAPGVVGIIGAAMCLCLMCGTFFSGGVLRIILAVAFYLAAGTLLLMTVGGYVPTRQFSVISFCLILLVRVLFFIPGFDIRGWVLEISDLAILTALILLPGTMKPAKPKQ